MKTVVEVYSKKVLILPLLLFWLTKGIGIEKRYYDRNKQRR